MKTNCLSARNLLEIKHLLFISFILCSTVAKTQCVFPSSQGDTLFPVINAMRASYTVNSGIGSGSSVFNIISEKGKYYLFGNFTKLSSNQGPGLIIDTANNSVRTPQKWRINGAVKSAVPDGQGGFFICGDFTKIGDSSRKYIARIYGNGQATSWNPKVDLPVHTIQQKNDTLFFGGEFSTFLGKDRNLVAIYSISGDSLLRSRVIRNISEIHSLLIKGDTLIMAGRPYSFGVSVAKYNIKDSVMINWSIKYTDYGTFNFMQFNSDSSLVIYSSDDNTERVRAFTAGGYLKFDIPTLGNIHGLAVSNNKVYVVGRFDRITPLSGGIIERKGFFAFNPNTGSVLPDDLQMDGYPTLLKVENGKIFLSGEFSKVGSITRQNFAMLNESNLLVEPWQLDPSNSITSLAFYNGTAFIGGHFNGINSVVRNGLAAIDSATKQILPWAPTIPMYHEGKRMIIKGDTLFILGITARPNSCMVNDFTTWFRMFRLSDGQQLSNTFGNTMTDFIIDSNYLYASINKRVSRFLLPSLTLDPSWGTDFTHFTGHSPTYLMIKGGEMYSVGDNRFTDQCTTLPERKGWFIVYNKATGSATKYYSYQGINANYEHIVFDHALLSNSKMYIQGYFTVLNGKQRRNFACIDVNTGALTDWQTSFTNTGLEEPFKKSSDLKLYNGKIWFGSDRFTDTVGNVFPGFAAIDTSTGNLLPPLFNLQFYNPSNNYDAKSGSLQDFIISDNSFIGVGGFDFIDGNRVSGVVNLAMNSGSAPIVVATSIVGPNEINVSTSLNRYHLSVANRRQNTYNWSYSGTGVTIRNNGSDTVWLDVAPAATSGELTVSTTNYCGTVALTQISIIIRNPPVTPMVTGIKNKCSAEVAGFGKLTNPPAGVNIVVQQDGSPLTYNSGDSSFQYFFPSITTPGSHTISIKYTGTNGVSQKDSSYTVAAALIPNVTITGDGNSICTGQTKTLTASPINGSSNPTYQWKVNGINSGTNSPAFTSGQLSSDAQVQVTMISNAGCLTTPTATSSVYTIVVNPILIPQINISGNTNVNSGDITMLTSISNNQGTAPVLQWQDSTSSTGWSNISGANHTTFNYKPLLTGHKVRCRLTSNAACANPTTVTSTPLTFTVNTITAVSNMSSEYGIRYFPNPASSQFTIDSLKINDQWESLSILSIDGQLLMMAIIRNKTSIQLSVQRLAPGLYTVHLRRKSGRSSYIRLIKVD